MFLVRCFYREPSCGGGVLTMGAQPPDAKATTLLFPFSLRDHTREGLHANPVQKVARKGGHRQQSPATMAVSGHSSSGIFVAVRPCASRLSAIATNMQKEMQFRLQPKGVRLYSLQCAKLQGKLATLCAEDILREDAVVRQGIVASI